MSLSKVKASQKLEEYDATDAGTINAIVLQPKPIPSVERALDPKRWWSDIKSCIPKVSVSGGESSDSQP